MDEVRGALSGRVAIVTGAARGIGAAIARAMAAQGAAVVIGDLNEAAVRASVASLRGRGRIINITSISGQRGNANRTAYGGPKAATELMTRMMTAELVGPGLTISAIAPGPIETEMSAALHDATTRRSYRERTPQGRHGTVEEVAAAAVFLASDAASYVCGQVLNVDGRFASMGFNHRGSHA